MSHAVGQLQEQLLSAQVEAQETHAAAELKHIEHESQAQALSQVCSPAIEMTVTFWRRTQAVVAMLPHMMTTASFLYMTRP